MLTSAAVTTNNRLLLSSVVVGTTLAASLFCDSGWKAYDGHCYFRASEQLSFESASKNCQLVGAYLVEIDTADENNWITQNLLKDKSCADPYQCGTWTGGNDISVENTFVWKTSNKPFSYKNWYGSNPDDYQTAESLDCGNLLSWFVE